MNETRKARLAAVIQEELSVVVRTLKDPRIPILTFTRVDVVDDGSQATVYISLLQGNSDRDRVKDCLEGLKSSAGFLRRHLAKVLTIRHIPNLIFKEDRGLENTLRVHELLREIGSTNTVETHSESNSIKNASNKISSESADDQ